MRNAAWLSMLLGAVVLLAGCGSPEPEPPAPVPAPDLPAIDLPDQPTSPPPAFNDMPADEPPAPYEPALGPELGDPAERFEPMIDEAENAQPDWDESAGERAERPGVTRAFGEALLKGFTRGAANSR